MKFVFPNFEDNNLQRWMMPPTQQLQQQSTTLEASLEAGHANQGHLCEALKKFHINSCNKKSLSSTKPQIMLPAILTSSNANTWLSSRFSKKAAMGSGDDLGRWLATGRKQEQENQKNSSDYSMWLQKTAAPVASPESGLPGMRVEFPNIPLSAFRSNSCASTSAMTSSATSGTRVHFPEFPLSAFHINSCVQTSGSDITTSTASTTMSSESSRWLRTKPDQNKWLATPSTAATGCAMDEDDDEDDDTNDELLNQWLLVERNLKEAASSSSSSAVVGGMSSVDSVEAWLLAAADDRDPSIVVIDEDFDDVISAFDNL